MFSTRIHLGLLHLPTYATLLSLGLVGGVILSVWQGPRRGFTSTQAFDAALLGAGSGLIGARAAYVVINWAYFRDHLSEAVRLWAGGLAWQGGLALGLLVVLLYAMRYRLSTSALLDTLALGLAWFTVCIWLGSGAANDVYGRETFPTDGLLWTLSADLPDLYGLRAPRVNVALLGSAWSGLIFAVLWLLRERVSPSGSLFFTYLALTGLGGLVLVPLQANAIPFLFRLRVDWSFSLVLAACGLAGLFAAKTGKMEPDAMRTITKRD